MNRNKVYEVKATIATSAVLDNSDVPIAEVLETGLPYIECEVANIAPRDVTYEAVVANDGAIPAEDVVSDRRLYLSGDIHWTWPKYERYLDRFNLLLSITLNFGLWGLYIYLFLAYVVMDKNGHAKPFKGGCFTTDDIVNHICFFSAGQLSAGIFSIGQVNIGLFCIGQVSIGLLFAFGQIAVGMGLSPIGQIASGMYVYAAQVGLGIYDVKYCQFGLRVLKCLIDNASGEVKPYTAGCT